MYPAIPTILRSQELLDKAFGRSTRIAKEDKVAFFRVRKTTLAQLESIRDLLLQPLERYVSAFPNLDKVSTYERELIDLVVGVDPLRRALGRVSGGADALKLVLDDSLRSAHRIKDLAGLKTLKRATIGRASSLVESLDPSLNELGRARDLLRAVPEVTPGDPTLVVAGYPNVGKSSLLARLSRARPEIAPYPYTTKSANLGHFQWPPDAPQHRQRRYQLVDTPGLLEKAPKDRNTIEKHAALALGYLADAIVFLLDPSESCGYTIARQERLLEQVRSEFSGIPVLVVENKVDLVRTDSDRPKVSCQTGQGIDELKQRLVALVPEDKYQSLLEDAGRS